MAKATGFAAQGEETPASPEIAPRTCVSENLLVETDCSFRKSFMAGVMEPVGPNRSMGTQSFDVLKQPLPLARRPWRVREFNQ